VLWLRDLYPGGGGGVIDCSGRPKVAYHYLRRALAPIAVWMTDEGLGGIKVHLANDRAIPLAGHLRLALYSDFEHRVEQISQAIALAPHETVEHEAETLLGRFLDISWAYRFGPPAQNLIIASLEADIEGLDGAQMVSQTVRFPVGYPIDREPVERIGLQARGTMRPDGWVSLSLMARRLAWAVRVDLPGFQADDDAFSLEPSVERVVMLRPLGADGPQPAGAVSAANMRGSVEITF
jgi:beta-mannosidase